MNNVVVNYTPIDKFFVLNLNANELFKRLIRERNKIIWQFCGSNNKSPTAGSYLRANKEANTTTHVTILRFQL